MSKEISTKADDLEPSILIQSKETVGQWFKGKMVSEGRNVESAYENPHRVFELEVIDGTMGFVQSKPNNEGEKVYTNVDVKVGQVVSVFASRRLARALDQIPVDGIVRFEYIGKVKTARGKAHDYKVTLED